MTGVGVQCARVYQLAVENTSVCVDESVRALNDLEIRTKELVEELAKMDRLAKEMFVFFSWCSRVTPIQRRAEACGRGPGDAGGKGCSRVTPLFLLYKMYENYQNSSNHVWGVYFCAWADATLWRMHGGQSPFFIREYIRARAQPRQNVLFAAWAQRHRSSSSLWKA